MSVQANPFKRTTIIIMFAIGFAAFIALLYGLGAGTPLSSGKNGEAHGVSNSLVGYKALADLMRKTGREVQYSRNARDAKNPGLLILTPAPYADGGEIAKLVTERATIGPTMIILPKWEVRPVPDPSFKKGWVQRFGTLGSASGETMLKNIAEVKIHVAENVTDTASTKSEQRGAITSTTRSTVGGPVKTPAPAVTMTGDYIRPIVLDQTGDGALVAYLDGGGGNYAVVLVADADLLNNSGMADKQTATHALALIDSVSAGADGAITFDLTLNGLGSSENLLTLAFRPPFLSATICLVIAALAAAWMAFNRFGPPMRERRSIDFGKTALVNNSAGFIHRMRREHLVAGPYGEIIRTEALHALGLPNADREDQNRKLDMLGEVDGHCFTALLDNLNSAHNPHETARWAAALYHWKKELIG